MRRRSYLLACLLLLLTSCHGQRLIVHSDYITKEFLASYHINTPDPLLSCPPLGQRIIVSWSVKHYCLNKVQIKLVIRFGNNQEQEITIPVKRVRGTFIYTLLNDDYFSRNGILTFKADLVANEHILESWRHQLWQELITIKDRSYLNSDANDLDFEIENISEYPEDNKNILLSR